MRLWSIHPEYLDKKGLVALWREALLAKKVLEGRTKGYKNHPQLKRFKEFKNPLLAINSYLFWVFEEGKKRGYEFKKNKISVSKPLKEAIPINKGQLKFEFSHLCKKLKKRDRTKYSKICKKIYPKTIKIKPHPLFYLREGGIEKWERGKF
jgi:hypothetical protein